MCFVMLGVNVAGEIKSELTLQVDSGSYTGSQCHHRPIARGSPIRGTKGIIFVENDVLQSLA